MEESSTGDRQFFDDVYRRGARKSVSKYYSVVQCSRRHYEELIFAHCPRKTVLEYGCGTGSYAFSLAKRGAKVTGVDISEVAIALAKERAAEMGVEDVSFHVMDAEQMQLEDNSFDAACGTGILHHLRLHQALKELARTLKPGGSATFIEPMGHNPAINLFRRLTPSLRAKDEHPLTLRDLELMRNFFHLVNFGFFHLFSLLAVPFKGGQAFSWLLRRLDDLDRRVFERIPCMRRMAWQVVIVLKGPKKAGPT